MASISGNITFDYTSVNCTTQTGQINGLASFCSNSLNCGVVYNAEFYDSSANLGIVYDAIFSGGANAVDGVICGTGIFYDSLNYGNVSGTLILRGNSSVIRGNINCLILCDNATNIGGNIDNCSFLVNYTTPTNVYGATSSEYFTYASGVPTLATGAWSNVYLGGHQASFPANGFAYSPVWIRSGVFSYIPFTYQAQNDNLWYIYIGNEYPTPNYSGTIANDFYINAAINSGELCTDTNAFVKKIVAYNYDVTEDFYKSYTCGIADDLSLCGFYLCSDGNYVYLENNVNVNIPHCSFILLLENSNSVYGLNIYQCFCYRENTGDVIIYPVLGPTSIGYFNAGGCYYLCAPLEGWPNNGYNQAAGSYINVNYCNSTPQLADNGTYLQFCNGLPCLIDGPYSNYYINALGYIADCTTYTPVNTLDTNECRFYVSGVACNPLNCDRMFDNNIYYYQSVGQFFVQKASDETKFASISYGSVLTYLFSANTPRGFYDGCHGFYGVMANGIGEIYTNHGDLPVCTVCINCCIINAFFCNGCFSGIANEYYSNGYFVDGILCNCPPNQPIPHCVQDNNCYYTWRIGTQSLAQAAWSNGWWSNGLIDSNINCIDVAVDNGKTYCYVMGLPVYEVCANGYYTDKHVVDGAVLCSASVAAYGSLIHASLYDFCDSAWIYNSQGSGFAPSTYGYCYNGCACLNCYSCSCNYSIGPCSTSYYCEINRLAGLIYMNNNNSATYVGFQNPIGTLINGKICTTCYTASESHQPAGVDEYNQPCGDVVSYSCYTHTHEFCFIDGELQSVVYIYSNGFTDGVESSSSSSYCSMYCLGMLTASYTHLLCA